MKIFSGSSNLPLAGKVAKNLGLKLAKIELSQFANGEIRVWVREKVARQKVFILQSLSNPSEKNLIELCLIADAVKRLGAKEITACVPWLAYTKQDKVFRPGEPLSAKVIAKIIQSIPIDSLITFDLHNMAMIGFFDIPVIHLSGLTILEKQLKKEITKHSVVVSIGAGGTKLSAGLAKSLNLPIAYLDSHRDLKTGKVTIQGISQKITAKDVLIIDDNIFTGSTLIQTSIFLKKEKAKSITVAATHHLFIPGTSEKLEKSNIDKLFITDTIKKPRGLKLKKTKTISIAPLIAKTVRKMIK
ncbi:ribose-phosphate pyrophosphokinase [Candidatus Microgenomates bacterium]|nr:ribose-phosphate pyrophosphokinase [Candidatus Microgenomates bacterium]